MRSSSCLGVRRIRACASLASLALVAAALAILAAPPVHGQEGEESNLSVSFGSSTISAKAYTAGHLVGSDNVRLPEVTVVDSHQDALGYEVDYSVSGLPAGLSMGSDRVIRGTPEAATSNPVTVTYTASVSTVRGTVGSFAAGETGSASLTFQVTVNPAVTWSTQAQQFFNSAIIAYVAGTGWENATFPEAQGGTGTLTYSLIHNSSGLPLADHVSSITFDSSSRTIGGTVSAGARYAVTYIATDSNGATASGYTEVRAGVGGL